MNNRVGTIFAVRSYNYMFELIKEENKAILRQIGALSRKIGKIALKSGNQASAENLNKNEQDESK